VLCYQAKFPPLLTSTAALNVQQSDLIIVAQFKSGWKSLMADA